jgi:DNA-binding CsgD family transcriptional regulator
MSPFVGRVAELALLRGVLADAAARHPHVVQIEGPAGVGKTALIERFLADPDLDPPPTVLRAGGDEAETLLAYGIIEQLVRSAGLAPRTVTGAEEPLDDAVTVGTRLLELLDRSDGAVIVVVDDAHWADRPSLSALLFALRRLVADPVLALIGVRDAVTGLPESLRRLVGGHQGTVISLPGLAEPELRDLAAQLGAPLSSVAARRLHDGTQGNPLHARALLTEFPPRAWSAGQSPLPAPRSFRLLVRDRWAACSTPARRFVDAASVLGMHSPLPQVAALAELADPLLPFDEAAAAGLLAEPGTGSPLTVSFPHPLVRSAVHDSLGVARRSALHAAAAALVGDAAAALRHRVAAAVLPDEKLAADLEVFGQHEARRQAWPAATAALVEAARQSPVPADLQRRLLEAVTWMLQNGDAANAAQHQAEIAAFAPGPDRDSVLGALTMAAGRSAEAEVLLHRAWEACVENEENIDPELAATIALQNAMHTYGRVDGAGTVTWCTRALERTGPDTVTRWAASTYLAHGLGYAGRTAESFAVVTAADGPDFAWLEPRSARGTLRMVEDDLDGARADLAAAAIAASRLGVLNTAAFSFAFLARAEYLAGEWDDAVMHADRAVAINIESDLDFVRSMVVGVAALVPAARGDREGAERILEGALRDVGDYERSVVAVSMSRARIGEADGDPDAVLAALEPVRRFPFRDGVDEPGFWAWPDLYAEALVAVGRAEDADVLLVPHEQRAAARGRQSSIARMARARGRVEAALGRTERAEAAFAHALAAVEKVAFPFDAARTRLAAGEFLRRSGQRRRAAELLHAAQRGFLGLGATPYAERCARELAASGLRPSPRRDRDDTRLTAQELVVARRAAAGLSNRELAAELVVSVKTVEYHLRNAFAKLGITSRRQLAARLDSHSPEGALSGPR